LAWRKIIGRRASLKYDKSPWKLAVCEYNDKRETQLSKVVTMLTWTIMGYVEGMVNHVWNTRIIEDTGSTK